MVVIKKLNNMRIVYIIFLISWIACSSQSTNNYIIESSKEIKTNEPILINKENRLLFKTDENLFYMNLYIQNIGEKGIFLNQFDSVEFTPYKSYVHLFKDKSNKSYVIFWETQYEQIPYTIVYYFYEDKILRIGEFEIAKACNTSEHYEFPIADIEIKLITDKLEFIFTKEIYYKLGKPDEKHLKPNSLKYIFNISTQKLELIESN